LIRQYRTWLGCCAGRARVRRAHERLADEEGVGAVAGRRATSSRAAIPDALRRPIPTALNGLSTMLYAVLRELRRYLAATAKT